MPRTVAFFMRGAARTIKGGHKVLFTYANCLAEKGLEVTIFFPAANSVNSRGIWRGARLLRYAGGAFAPHIYLPDSWMRLHAAVQTRWVWRCRPEHARQFDISVLADHAVGADVMASDAARARSDATTLYLFQEYEYYMTGRDATRAGIEKTIRSADVVIAISPVARDLAMKFTSERLVHLVNNGVELDKYFVMPGIGPEQRRAIGFAFREEGFKRTADVVAALTDLRSRNRLSDFACWAYGSVKAPRLPGWIQYHYRPTSEKLCELLNHSAIFVVASLYEGWGLPGAEAMACGAALVSTRNGGCEAYATHLENALLCSPGNLQELTESVQQLLDDPELRARLAMRGLESIQRFTWGAACARFLQVIDQVP